MGKHGVLLRIFKQYHIEWIWYLSKEMRYLILFAAGIFALDQLFKHAIDEEPKGKFPQRFTRLQRSCADTKSP